MVQSSASSSHRLGLALAIGLVALCGLHAAAQFWRGDLSDFIHFYRAASALSSGENIYAAARGRYIYPPLFAFILQPLIFLPAHWAAIVWTAISGTLIFFAICIAAKEAAARWSPINRPQGGLFQGPIAAGATLLSLDKIHATLTLGQTDGIMLLAFACVLRWMVRAPYLAGLAVGASANIKYLSLIYVPFFLLKRNGKAAFAAVASFAFFLVLPGFQIGFARVIEYAVNSLGGLGRLWDNYQQPTLILSVTWDRSISLTSAVFRFAHRVGLSDLVALAVVVLLLSMFLGAVILIGNRHGVRLYQSREVEADSGQTNAFHIEWAILIFIAVAFSPQSTARHMILLLLVYSVAIAIFLVQKTKAPRIFLATAVLVSASSLSLPFWMIGLASQRENWRAISGASWCALALILGIVWVGARTIASQPRSPERTSHCS